MKITYNKQFDDLNEKIESLRSSINSLNRYIAKLQYGLVNHPKFQIGEKVTIKQGKWSDYFFIVINAEVGCSGFYNLANREDDPGEYEWRYKIMYGNKQLEFAELELKEFIKRIEKNEDSHL